MGGFDDLGAKKLAARPLDFIWCLDISGSMSGNKINSLNFAIKEAIPEMQRVAGENPTAEVRIKTLVFGSTAYWKQQKPEPIAGFKWKDVTIDGSTAMGAAFKLLTEELDIKKMPERGLPPVIVLITDGAPTDSWKTPLQDLLKSPWGMKAVRLAIAIGDDCNEAMLKEFINNSELPVLKADNAQTLVNYIKWVSTVVVQSASAPPSQPKDKQDSGNVPIPSAPAPITTNPKDPNDIF